MTFLGPDPLLILMIRNTLFYALPLFQEAHTIMTRHHQFPCHQSTIMMSKTNMYYTLYSICINCQVVFDIHIVITNATTTTNDDDKLYSSTTSNGQKKSTTSTPHSNHDADNNFTPRGSRHIPIPSIQWYVMLHEILPAVNGGITTASE